MVWPSASAFSGDRRGRLSSDFATPTEDFITRGISRKGVSLRHAIRRCRSAQLAGRRAGIYHKRRFGAKDFSMTDVSPERSGFDAARLQQAYALLQRWTDG